MLASTAKLVLGRAAPAGERGRLSVLIYHRVLAEPDPLHPGEPSAIEFDTMMRWVKKTFEVIPLEEGIAGLKTRRLPERALCITFDDGYANNASIAAPILARLGLHATFFIATGYLDGGRMFNDTIIETVRAAGGPELDLRGIGLGRYAVSSVEDRLRTISELIEAVRCRPVPERTELTERAAEQVGAKLPVNLMMTSAQVAGLARAGFALGAHTVNHPILSRLPADSARREIVDGKRRVEDLAGSRVTLFAYPNGRPGRDYVAATVELVKTAGFDGAASTSGGAAYVGSDPFQVPRFTPWDRNSLGFAARMWSNLARSRPVYAQA
jgi:peptidoglycan/xylan/chitin deacetylase (PgdA/CDA1 family)